MGMPETGVVKKFFPDKGFGFITPDDGGEDVFVHRKCNGEDRTAYLEEGDKVEYEKQWEDQKGKWSCSSCTGFKSGGDGERASRSATAKTTVTELLVEVDVRSRIAVTT